MAKIGSGGNGHKVSVGTVDGRRPRAHDAGTVSNIGVEQVLTRPEVKAKPFDSGVKLGNEKANPSYSSRPLIFWAPGAF
jgi:hypothetical protein